MKSFANILIFICFCSIISCKKIRPPELITSSVTEISWTTANVSAEILNNGGQSITSQGVCWNNSGNPSIYDNKGIADGESSLYTVTLNNLTPNAVYYVRAFATNSTGTGYGNLVTFTTKQMSVPGLGTADISSLTRSSVKSGGSIASDNGSSITNRGVCWSTTPDPTVSDSKTEDGSGGGNFESSVTGLLVNTDYHLRAYAVNEMGVGYGNDIIFRISMGEEQPSVTDIDANTYRTVKIGNQIWMAENLKVTKYCDGSNVQNVTQTYLWGQPNTGAYCWYNNDQTNKNLYGALYNYYAVVNSRKLCPVTWRVPTDQDWTELINFLGGVSVAGSLLKESGNLHWLYTNTGTNESQFSALPGGYRDDITFTTLGSAAFWWSSTENFNVQYSAWSVYVFSQYPSIVRTKYEKYRGFSVRCIKN